MSDHLTHLPVLVDEVIDQIRPEKNKFYFDGTFGQGGYSKKILEKVQCNVLSIDRDPDSSSYALNLKNKYPNNFHFEIERFSNIETILIKRNVKHLDGILLDLGISNTQLNNPERGFSFSNDGPLDMRMNKDSDGITAEKVINEFSERKLSEIFYFLGEEKNSRKISRSIIEFRKKKRIYSTQMLSKIIEKINFHKKIHPSTRVFQALRIFVNNELLELESFLKKCLVLLNKKSRIAIVSFHSLEDRIVKKFFKDNSIMAFNNYKHLPEKKKSTALLKLITKKAITPSEKEIKNNPRSRSAKLRVAEKI
ncbi:MAG: hypothetical protein CMM99_02085 [Rickettsiales bacterium]|nr:hypothetical protein [Rickettsiales bacterium]